MIEQAIKQIRKEMEENKNTPYIQAFGNHVINNTEINVKVASEIVEKKKTLKDALKKVEDEARKKVKEQKGVQCVVMSPEEVFKIVDKYYEFEAIQSKEEVIPGTREVKKEEPKRRFNVDLNSLLRRR